MCRLDGLSPCLVCGCYELVALAAVLEGASVSQCRAIRLASGVLNRVLCVSFLSHLHDLIHFGSEPSAAVSCLSGKAVMW